MNNGHTTLAEHAFQRTYSLIMSGELPLGAVVNEVTLSQRFDISRGPIREAVRRLQGLKLVTREPYMRARVVSLSNTDILEIFQLRQAVEGMACRLCATNMSSEALDALMHDFERSQRLASDGHKRPIFDLHVAIAAQCGNRRIEHLLCEELYHLLRLYRLRSGNEPGRRDQATDEHWQILRALQKRDAALAESLMHSHIMRAASTLMATDGA